MFTTFYFKADDATAVERRKRNQVRFTCETDANLGKIYPAKRRVGERPFKYLRITGIRQEFLGQITDADAKKEGFPHVPAFKKDWKRRHGSWDPHQLVWVVDYEVATEAEYLKQKMLKGAA
ncbi:MAG: hypothetical protein ABFD18_06425 [Syntrophomonas sp.]